MSEISGQVEATLVFPVYRDSVHLAEKTTGIGKGCLNGYGGMVEKGESIERAACREFFEETGGAIVSEKDLLKVAIAHFYNTKEDGSVFTCRVHVFLTNTWYGDIESTPEMQNPRWYSIISISRRNLMLADKKWLRRIFSGRKVVVRAWYGPRQQTLLRPVEVTIVDVLPEE